MLPSTFEGDMVPLTFEGDGLPLAFEDDVLPLTPGGVMNNRIDPEKLKTFLRANEEGRDYLLLDPLDPGGLERCYRESPFRVAAFCKQGGIAQGNRFFALPKDQLGFPRDE